MKKFNIVLAIIFATLLAYDAFAECDVRTLRTEMIAPYKQAIPADSSECRTITGKGCKRGFAIAKNFLFTESPFQVKNENFVMLTFDAVTKFPNDPEIVSKMMVVRSVDMASCTLDIYERDNVFGTSLK
jgi:hypothetical protein